MNLIHLGRLPRRGRIAALLGALPCLLAAVFASAGAARAQMEADADWINKDYFTASQDPTTKALLENVERNHLSPDNFFRHYNAGEYQYAANDLKYTLRVFPNHPKALYYLTSCARLMRQPSLPVPLFLKAIERFPQHAYTHAQYGTYLVEIGQAAGGIEKLKAALEIDPSLAPAEAWLAGAYYAVGDVAQAKVHEAKARELGWRGPIGEVKPPPPAPPEKQD